MRKTSRNMSLNAARKSSYVFEYRITFLGAERVGKSAIINQFVEKKFMTRYTPTSEDHLTHVVEHRGNMCVCLLVDTAGSDDFPAMRKLSVTKGNAFIVVYAVDSRKSYERAKKFISEIKEVKEQSAEVKIVLVGNKNDAAEEKCEVSYSEALSYAGSLHEGNVITAFTESSARDYESVTEIIQKLLNMFIPPPPSIEVPVLKDGDGKRKLSFSKFRASTRMKGRRRSSVTNNANTVEHENDESIPCNSNKKNSLRRNKASSTKEKQQSFSDSEIPTPVCPVSPETSRILTRTFRSRSESTPVVKVPQRLLSSTASSSPSTTTVADRSSSPENSYYNNNNNNMGTPKHQRLNRRTSSPLHTTCIQEIGSPVLISHSLSLNGYAMPLQQQQLTKGRSNSHSGGNCSDDSGVSDDCSPEMPKKFNMGRRASLPVHNTQLPPFGFPSGRRSSISEKMKGIFRKKSSAEIM